MQTPHAYRLGFGTQAAFSCELNIHGIISWRVASTSLASTRSHSCRQHDTNHNHHRLPRLRQNQSVHPSFPKHYSDPRNTHLTIPSPHPQPHPPTPADLQTRPPQKRIRRRSRRQSTRHLARHLRRPGTPQWLHMLQPRRAALRRTRHARQRHRPRPHRHRDIRVRVPRDASHGGEPASALNRTVRARRRAERD